LAAAHIAGITFTGCATTLYGLIDAKRMKPCLTHFLDWVDGEIALGDLNGDEGE